MRGLAWSLGVGHLKKQDFLKWPGVAKLWRVLGRGGVA